MHKLSKYFLLLALLVANGFMASTVGQPSFRIVNGEQVKTLDYPWMVELREQDEGVFSRSCGGTIIHASWVLTAAHCVADLQTGAAYPSENYEVRVGNLNLAESDGSIVKIKQIVLPQDPSFNPASLETDIALLELAEPVTQTPITLLSKTADPIPSGMQAMLTGWGRLAENLPGYLINVYTYDPRFEDLAEPQFETEDQLTEVMTYLSQVVSDEEIIKVILAAPQIGLKKRYDTTLTFLDKVIVEGTVAFSTLAHSFALDPETARFSDLMQAIKNNQTNILDVIQLIAQVYAYEQGQLQQLYYPIVPTIECEASGAFSETEENQAPSSTAGMLCVGFERGGKSACSGDSGGPLSLWNGTTGQWTQVGLVSFSSLCSARHSYDVYTRVSHYMDFIKQHVPEAQFVTMNYQDMQQCNAAVTPKPFAPQFEVNQQQKYVKLFWEPTAYAQDYVLTYAPYSNPLSKVTLDNIQLLPLTKETHHIDTVLPQGSDFFVTVQARNCAGLSEYAPIYRIQIPSN